MKTRSVTLSNALDAFIDEEAAAKGFASAEEYLGALIRRERDLARLKRFLLDGAESEPTGPADETWFAELRARYIDDAA